MAVQMQRRADVLRLIALRVGLADLTEVVQRPGVSEAYRITVQYHDARHPDQVATLTHTQGGAVMLAVVYRHGDQHPGFEYPVDVEVYRAFDLVMRRLGFDRRDDQPDLPYHGEDLWLIERASGSYLHDIVIAPGTASGVYSWFIDAVRLHLPMAVQPLRQG